MAYSGLNLGNVKNQNRSSILKLLNDHGPMPRKDLSARLGLTPASLTTLCGELLAQNILFELGEVQQEDKRAGRRKILLGHQLRLPPCSLHQHRGPRHQCHPV